MIGSIGKREREIRGNLYKIHDLMIYIYILSSTYRLVSFYKNSSVWRDRIDSRSWDRNPVDSNANPRFCHSATRKPAQVKEI